MQSFVLLIFTNFLVYFIAIRFSLERNLINIDYIFCLFLIFFNLRKTAIFFFIIFFIADLLLLTRQIFPFFRLDDILYILKFVFISSLAYKILIFLIVIYVFAISWIIKIEKGNNKRYIYFVILISFIFLTQNIYIAIFNYPKVWLISQLVAFIELQNYGFSQSFRMKEKEMQPLPYSPALKHLYTKFNNNEKLNHNVIFIINESLGVPKNNKVLDEIISPLYQNSRLIGNISIDQISYAGPTVYAELRELCHAQPYNFNFKNLKTGFNKCLPHYFQQQGYRTIALHGALGNMYDRKYWYPRAGFKESIFYESYPWKHRCYSFPGACDWEISKLITSIFNGSKQPQFIYWLTLNSHSRYDKRDIFFDVFNCKKFNIEENTESCRNIRLQAQFFYILNEMLKSIKIKNLEVIIVGDHTPVIFDKAEKEKYFDENKILMINFKLEK